MTLLPFQKTSIEKQLHWLKTNPTRAVYNACEMGLGKTLQTLEVVKALKAKSVLVVCPAGVVPVWKTEIQKWWPDCCADIEVVSYNFAASKKNLPLINRPFDVLVIEEAHFAKNPKAQRTKAVLNVLWNNSTYRIALSGTPFTQSVMDCWPIFSRILPEHFGDYWKFAYTYTKVKKTPWGDKFEGIKNADKLKELIRGNFFIRYTKDEVLKELPEKVVQEIYLGPEYLVKRSAEEADAEEAYLKLLEHAYKKGHPIRTPPPVAIATKRREQAIKKLPAIVDFCKNFLDSSESLVVFAYHRDVISALETQLEEFLPAVIHGGTSESDRAKAVKDFQSGATSLFIGQLTAAGTGITLTRASNCVFAELDWNPANNDQAASRIHRIGQTNHCHYYHFCVKGSVDERVAAVVFSKKETFEKVLK